MSIDIFNILIFKLTKIENLDLSRPDLDSWSPVSDCGSEFGPETTIVEIQPSICSVLFATGSNDTAQRTPWRKMKSLADPTRLKPTIKKERLVQTIIETPAGSRNKFAYDPDQGIFALKAVLPAGMTFPYDFGFLPQTLAADGDPIDVLLLMDQPAFPGIAVRARLVGVIQGEQIEGKKKIRNDRLVAVAEANHAYANVRRLKDLPGKWMKEVEDFFVNYHNLEGKKYRLLGCESAEVAFRLLNKARIKK